MKKCIVAVKINSIQEYIFHSNKLKENIGASQITDHEVFHVIMENILTGNFQYNSTIVDKGGGGALVRFDNEEIASKFVKKFSLALLLNYPGLKTSFAVKDDFDFMSHKKELYDELADSKSRHPVNTSIQKHGITADCPLSNESAEQLFEGQYISNASFSRINAASKSLKNYTDTLDKPPKYSLTTEIEQLGQNEEASYIAVVHIDGNGMGSRFAKINSEEELSKSSKLVKNAAVGAMNSVIKDLIDLLEKGDGLKELSLKKDKDSEKVFLPVRPILAGGDDITFVCEGRLGMYLAEKFIYYFTENGKSDLMDGACAGVAIVKTKFPFYKAYELAEELCKEAKELCRKDEGEPDVKKSYISYYYSATTFSGSLEQLRERTHQIDSNHFAYSGPYNVFDDSEDSIKKLKTGIKHFNNDEKFPKNKVMRLREVIAESEPAQKLFLKELQEAEKQLPDGGKVIWNAKISTYILADGEIKEKKEYQTPYFDQIELMDFYPNDLL